jgi:MFS transporter, MHS family, proline/betaine transporter
LTGSPVFQRRQEFGDGKNTPVVSVITSMPTKVLCVFGVIFLPSVQSVIFIWLPTYLSHMVRPPIDHALLINTLCMCVHIALFPVGGWLSDSFGRKSIFIASGIGTLILAYPLFLWMDQGIVLAAVVSQLVFAVLLGVAWGALPALMVEMFPTSMRVSGIGLAYNGGMASVYGTAPWIATWLINTTGGDLAAPAYYVMLMALLSLIAALGIGSRVGEALE